MKRTSKEMSDKTARMVATMICRTPSVQKDNRSFIEKLLTSIIVSPLYDRKRGLHGLTVKSSFKF